MFIHSASQIFAAIMFVDDCGTKNPNQNSLSLWQRQNWKPVKILGREINSAAQHKQKSMGSPVLFEQKTLMINGDIKSLNGHNIDEDIFLSESHVFGELLIYPLSHLCFWGEKFECFLFWVLYTLVFSFGLHNIFYLIIMLLVISDRNCWDLLLQDNLVGKS